MAKPERVQEWVGLGNDSIVLPPQAAAEEVDRNDHEMVRSVFVSYENLHRLLEPQDQRRLNSRIISLSISPLAFEPQEAPSRPLKSSPVTIKLYHLRPKKQGEVNECVFWEASSRLWSGKGCEAVAEDAVSTTCKCQHLTAFALLVSEREFRNGVSFREQEENQGSLLRPEAVLGLIGSAILLVLILLAFQVRLSFGKRLMKGFKRLCYVL